MNTLDEILSILNGIRGDKAKLNRVLEFLQDEVYKEVELFPKIDLPEQFLPLVKEIAESISHGMVCFLNLNTLEIEEIPDMLYAEIDEGNLEESKAVLEGYDFPLELKHLGGKINFNLKNHRPGKGTRLWKPLRKDYIINMNCKTYCLRF